MLNIKEFPNDMSNLQIDFANTKKCLISGLFREEVEIRGEKRTFYTYIAPDLTYNQPCLVIAPPEGVTVPEWIENGFWRNFAERENVFLHFLEPDGMWKLDGIDADYMNRVYVQIQSRKYYVTMQDNIYAVGIGRGATVAQQAAMKMTSEWSGLATFGDLEKEALLNAAITQEAEGNIGKVELSISAEKAQLPVWMAWSENTGHNKAVCDYWRKQNDTAEEAFSNADADEIYFPSTVYRKSTINEEKISQIRITNGYTGHLTGSFFKAVWTYIKKARRHRCFGSKALRNFKKPEDYGAELHTMEIGGFTRLWYEYVPEHVKREKKPVPLVINMHGRGGSAESFMDLSGMSCVAEERGFIVLFPEAGISQQNPKGIQNVLLWNGSYRDQKIDDVSFILEMIRDVKKRYAIDAERIYACGQSSGGMMTSELAIRAPGVFAAVSPWSAIKDPDHQILLPEQIEPQVPYLFLLGEHDWLCVDKENGQLEYSVTKDIAAFLEHLMDLYGLDKTPKRYRCGEISYYVYVNPKRIPMLTVGVIRDMSHANYPGESWVAYDEFFAKFSKKADGTLLYMGEEAVSAGKETRPF